MAEQRTLNDLAKQLKGINKQLGQGGEAGTTPTTAGLTAGQALVEQKRQQKLADEQKALDLNSYNLLTTESKKLYKNQEELRALRDEGAYDAVLIHNLQKQQAAALKGTDGAEGADYKQATRALEMATQFADQYAADTGQAQPRYKTDYLSNPELVENLATDDGFGLINKALNATLAGTAGLFADINEALPNIPVLSDAFEGALRLGKAKSEATLGNETDLGSLGSQLETRATLNRMRLEDGHPDKLSLGAGALKVAKDLITNADGVGDLGATMAGVIAPGAGVAKTLSVTTKLGPKALAYSAGVTSSGVGGGLESSAEDTGKQAATRLATALVAGTFSAIPGGTISGSLANRSRLFNSRIGNTALGGVVEGAQEAVENVGQGLASSGPDGAFKKLTSADFDEAKINAAVGFTTGFAVGAPLAGLTSKAPTQTDPEAPADPDAPPPPPPSPEEVAAQEEAAQQAVKDAENARSSQRTPDERSGYDKLTQAQTPEDAASAAREMLEAGNRGDVELHADALNELLLDAVEADDLSLVDDINNMGNILDAIDNELKVPDSELQTEEVVEEATSESASETTGPVQEPVQEPTSEPVQEPTEAVEEEQSATEQLGDEVNRLRAESLEDASLKPELDKAEADLNTLTRNEASIQEDLDTIQTLETKLANVTNPRQADLFQTEIANLSNNIDALETKNDEIAQRAKLKVKLKPQEPDVSVGTEAEVKSKDLDITELASKLRAITTGDAVDRYDLRDDQIVRARRWLEQYDGAGFGGRENKFKDEARKLLNRANAQAGSRRNSSLGRRTLSGNVEAPAPGAVQDGVSEVQQANVEQPADPIALQQVANDAYTEAAAGDQSVRLSDPDPETAGRLSNLKSYANEILGTLGVKPLDHIVSTVASPNEQGFHATDKAQSFIGINSRLLSGLSTDTADAVQVMRHELGHHVVATTYLEANEGSRQALLDDFNTYIATNKPALLEQFGQPLDLESFQSLWIRSGPARGTSLLNGSLGAKEYVESFTEYLANRFGARIEARDNARPSTINKFFSDIQSILRNLYDNWLRQSNAPSAESDQLFDDYLRGVFETRDLRGGSELGTGIVGNEGRPHSADTPYNGNIDFITIGKAAREGVAFSSNDIPAVDRRYSVNKETSINLARNALGSIHKTLAKPLIAKQVPKALQDKIAPFAAQSLSVSDTNVADALQYLMENLDSPDFSDGIKALLDGRLRSLATKIRKDNPRIFSDAIADLDVILFTYPTGTLKIQESRILRGPPDPDEYITVDENGRKVYNKISTDLKRPDVSDVVVAKTFTEQIKAGFKGEPQFPGDTRNRGQQFLDSKNSLYERAKQQVENSRSLSRSIENRLNRNIRKVPNLLENVQEQLKDTVEGSVFKELVNSSTARFSDLMHIHSNVGTQASRAQTLYDSLDINTIEGGEPRNISLRGLHASAEDTSAKIREITGATHTEQQLTEDKFLVARMAEEANPLMWAMRGAQPIPAMEAEFNERRGAFQRGSLSEADREAFIELAADPSAILNAADRDAYAPSGMTDVNAQRIISSTQSTSDLKELYNQLSSNYQAQLRYMDKVRNLYGVESKADRQARRGFKFKNFVPIEGTELTNTSGLDYFFRERNFEGTFGIHATNNVRDNDRTDAGLNPMRQSVTATINQRSKQLLSEFAGRDTAAGVMLNSAASSFSSMYRDNIDSQTYTSSLTDGSAIQEYSIDDPAFRELMLDNDINRVVHYDRKGKALVVRLNDEGTRAVKGAHNAFVKSFEEWAGDRGIYSAVGYGTRFMSKQQTWYHIPFTLYNTVREVMHTSYLLQLDNDRDRGDTRQFINNVFDVGGQVDMAKWVKLQLQGTASARIKQEALMENSKNADLLAELQEFYQQGGPTVISSSFGRQIRNSSRVKDLGRNLNPTAKAALKNVDTFFENLNTSAELITRLSYYRMLKRRGMTPRQAASKTKDLTNFENQGVFGGPMGALYMFSRAAATGNVKAMDDFLESEHKGRAAVMLVGLGAMHYVVANMFAPDDDEGRNKVAESSGKLWTRNAVHFIPGTDTPVRLSYGFGITGFMQAIGAQFARFGLGHQTISETEKNLRSVALDSLEFLPAGSGNNLWSKAAPSPIRPWVDIGLNLNQFDAPIRGKFSPASFTKNALEGGRDNTIGGPWDDFARALDKVTLGTVKFNPDDLAYISRFYAGFISYSYEAVHENVRNQFPGDEDYLLRKNKGLWPLTSVVSPYFSRQAEVFYENCSRDSDDPACKSAYSKLGKLGRKFQQPIRNPDNGAGTTQRLQLEQKKAFEEIYRDFNIDKGLTRPD